MRKNLSQSVTSCRDSLKSFFDQMVGNCIHNFNADAQYSTKLIIENLVDEFGPLENELDFLNRSYHVVRNNVRKMRELLLDIDETKEDFLELHQLLDRGDELVTDTLNLIQITTTNQQYENVYWYEGVFKNFNGKTQFILSVNMSPIDISEDLSSGIFKSLNASGRLLI